MKILEDGLNTQLTWVLEITLLSAILLGINFLVKILLKKLPLYTSDKTDKEKAFHLFYPPCRLLFWMIGIFFSLDLVLKNFEYYNLASDLKDIRTTSFVLIFFWLILRWKKDFIQKLASKQRGARDTVDVTMFHVLDRVITMALTIVTLLIILGVFGLNITPLITFGGVGAAAVGFAARDVIGNFFGGMMLYITRPIMVNDNILIPEKRIEGIVEEIGWYLTCIRDKDKRPLYLPNAIFASSYLINASRMTHKRMEQTFYLQLDSIKDLDKIIVDMQAFLNSHPNIDHSLASNVYLAKIKDSAIELVVNAYSLLTKDSEFYRLQNEVIYRFHKILEESGHRHSEPTVSISTPIAIISK